MDLEGFRSQVKHNCIISDARYWGYYSVCGLLLRMRELYLSEKGLPPWQTPPHSEIADWICLQEKRWQELESSELLSLQVDGSSCSAFDTEGINTHLEGSGLVYGAGYGTFNKPVFFLAKLVSDHEVLDYRVRLVESELCRDLSIHPAMLQGRCIFIRLDAVRSILWDKLQTVSSRKCKGPLSSVFDSYGLKAADAGSADFLESLNRMVSDASEIFLWHEIGEAFEDEHVDDWAAMILCIEDKYAELYLRGIKDIIADTSGFGPLTYIQRKRDHGLLTLYTGLLDGIRKDLFPEALQTGLPGGDWPCVEEARIQAYNRVTSQKKKIIGVWNENRSAQAVAALVRELYPPR